MLSQIPELLDLNLHVKWDIRTETNEIVEWKVLNSTSDIHIRGVH